MRRPFAEPSSKVHVRPARLEADAGFMVDAVRRYLNPAADAHRFEWLYHGNPDGEAKAWIAEDGPGGAPIGMAAAFPRRVHLHGREDRAWILGDFCVADGHRTLGPALLLQRACLAGIAGTGAAIIYDLPGAGMMPVYRRLGIAPFGQMRRLAKPLRVDGRMRGTVPDMVRRPLGRAGNSVLALLDARHSVGRDLEVAVEAGPCGRDYCQLAARTAAGQAFCVRRSAAYLNWRYLRAPHRRYRLLAARRRGDLSGYVVLDRDGEVGWIVDLFAGDEPSIRSLVAAAVASFRDEGATTVTMVVVDGHPWIDHIVRLGFRRREVTPVVVCGGDGRALPSEKMPRDAWLLVQGDRES